jgi:hypothetical protein
MPVFIATNGDEFVVQSLDRSTRGKLAEALKVAQDGTVTVAGQTISSSGVVGSTGAVTATTVTASGLVAAQAALTVGTTLGVTGAATLSSTLGVTGATTLPAATTIGGKTPMTGSDYSVCQAGRNLAGALTLTGALVGDTVIAATNITTPGDVKSSFEATITVNGQIQQSAATNLAAQQILFILHHT